MFNFRSGDTAQINMPDPMPQAYYDVFGSRWSRWIKKLNQKMVTVAYHDGFLIRTDNDEIHITAWMVDPVDPSLDGMDDGGRWVPEMWLTYIDPDAAFRFSGLCDNCGGINLHDRGCNALKTQERKEKEKKRDSYVW